MESWGGSRKSTGSKQTFHQGFKIKVTLPINDRTPQQYFKRDVKPHLGFTSQYNCNTDKIIIWTLFCQIIVTFGYVFCLWNSRKSSIRMQILQSLLLNKIDFLPLHSWENFSKKNKKIFDTLPTSFRKKFGFGTFFSISFLGFGPKEPFGPFLLIS